MESVYCQPQTYKIKPEDTWRAGNIVFCDSCMNSSSFANLKDVLELPNDILALINEYYIGPKQMYLSFLDNRLFETLFRNHWIWFLFFCDANHVTIYIHHAGYGVYHFFLTHPTKEIEFVLYKQYTYKELEQILMHNQHLPLECDIWQKLRYAMFATYHIYHDHTFVTQDTKNLQDKSLLYYFR